MSTSTIINTSYLPDILRKELQFQYDKNTIMTKFANRDFEGELKQAGDTVSVQEFPNLLFDVNTSSSAGGTISTQTFATAKHDLVVNKLAQAGVKVADLEEVRNNFDTKNSVSGRLAYELSQNHERHIANIMQQGAGTVINNVAGAMTGGNAPLAFTVSNVLAQLQKFGAALEVENIDTSKAAMFIDPLTFELIPRSTELITNAKAVEIMTMSGRSYFGSITTGFTGVEINGVKVYKTNNLPYKNTLTIDTNGTANDTITVTLRDPRKKSNETRDVTITWTCKANGTAAAAGEISIGAGGTALVDFQASVRQAINGTGTAGASNYIDVSADNRKLLKYFEVSVSAFASNVATIYANNKVVFAETLTAATNIFGTAGRALLACVAGSTHFVDQMTRIKTTDGELSFSANVLAESAYQGAVLGQNKFGLVVNYAQVLSL